MPFKVTCDDVILICSVLCINPIHTWLSIPNYHHWNYVVFDSPLYRVFNSWVQVDQTCSHQCQHRCYVRELKQFYHQISPRWVAEDRGWDLISLIANFHLLPPIGGWLSNFGVFNICMTLLQKILYTTNKEWNYCRQYCIKQINQSKIE